MADPGLFPEPAFDWDACFDPVPSDWKDITEPFRRSPAGEALRGRLNTPLAQGRRVFPADALACLRLTRRQQVRVVVLGQDPYHGAGQAHGLAFSVPQGVPIPPSLRNIRREFQRDLKVAPPPHGSLQAWAEAGVLLLNTVLTVEEGRPASHAGWGWETLTDALIEAVAQEPGPRVFLLWGAHAQRKRPLIERAAALSPSGASALLCLSSNHPSPLSALRGPQPFAGNGHFSSASRFLAGCGVTFDGW